jgi:hypothetical protein
LWRQLNRIESMIAAPDKRNSASDVCALYTRAIHTLKDLRVLYGSDDGAAGAGGAAAGAGASAGAGGAAAVAAAVASVAVDLERDEAMLDMLAAKRLRFMAQRCGEAASALAQAAKARRCCCFLLVTVGVIVWPCVRFVWSFVCL